MKNYIYILSSICCLLIFSGCEKDSQDPSVLTYYVKINIIGGEEVTIPIGGTFEHKGITATEEGVDVTSKVKTVGVEDVDTSKKGIYRIFYSATNKDGFSNTVVRTIYVYDPAATVTLPEELTVQEDSYRLYYATATAAAVTTAYSGYKVKIKNPAPGIFYISDFFGGYYDQRAAYGSAYAMTGYFSINTDNSIELLESGVQAWNDSLDFLKNGVYSPSEKSITWKIGYGKAMEFNIILK